MELSFWELNSFFRNRQLVVVGSGIVGLNAAISYKSRFPRAQVLVLERGILPLGASTKNAGFACFGSVSELLSDLEKNSEQTVFETVNLRLNGLKRLRKIVGDKNMSYLNFGGYEVFDDKKKFQRCADSVTMLNSKLKTITGRKETFLLNTKKISDFGMKGFDDLIESPLESQIDTGEMMKSLLEIAIGKGISVLNGISVSAIEKLRGKVILSCLSAESPYEFEIQTEHLVVATNGFAKRLLPQLPVTPARAQVLITQPVKNLQLKGAFHYDEGYYYFRNFGERVLFGGGRNLDFEGETTDNFGLTQQVQTRLSDLLHNKIVPGKKVQIDHRWSGIMGLGKEKKPIIKKLAPNIVVAVRMGGMGVAIGSMVGELAVKELVK